MGAETPLLEKVKAKRQLLSWQTGQSLILCCSVCVVNCKKKIPTSVYQLKTATHVILKCTIKAISPKKPRFTVNLYKS